MEEKASMAKSVRQWLMKTEPSTFSIDDLRLSPERTTSWEGVRNYQARNFMRAMQRGDCVLLYHSNADPPAVVGIAKVVRRAYPDPSAWDKRSKYYDPKSVPSNPIWEMVDIKLVRKFGHVLPLDVLRRQPGLKKMELLRKGSRLSVQPVRPNEWNVIVKMAER